MRKYGVEAEVLKLPKCDICLRRDGPGPRAEVPDARYDARTWGGPWAYLCQRDFDQYGVGLGVGRGQRLVLAEEK